MRRELGARLLDRRAGAQAANRANEVAAAIRVGRREPIRHEDIGLALGIRLDVPEARRQHADDRRRPRVDVDRAADDRRIAAVAALPEAVAQNDDARPVRARLLRR